MNMCIELIMMQIEDPTPELRRLRDKKDLNEMLSMDWLTSEATTKLLDVENRPLNSDVSKVGHVLSPNSETITKLCANLMMNKKQAQRMWESLLFAIAAKEGDAKMAIVQGYVSQQVEEEYMKGAKDTAKDKVVIDTHTGFVMCKKKNAGKNVPGNIPPVENVTGEQQRLMMEEYVSFRMEEMKALIGMDSRNTKSP